MQYRAVQRADHRYIVIDDINGEILDENNHQGFFSSREALAHFAKANNYNFSYFTAQYNIKWWLKHYDLWKQLNEIKYEELNIKEPILDFELFKQAMLRSHYAPNLPFQLLWQNFPSAKQLKEALDEKSRAFYLPKI